MVDRDPALSATGAVADATKHPAPGAGRNRGPGAGEGTERGAGGLTGLTLEEPMRPIITVLAAAALAASAAACSPQSEPEPANETVAEAMPETPDRSDTAADEKAAGMATPEPAGEAKQPEPAPAY